MAIFRKKKHPQDPGMSPFKARSARDEHPWDS